MNRKLFRRAAPGVVLLVLILGLALKWQQSTTLSLPPPETPAAPDLYRVLLSNRQKGRPLQALYDIDVLAAQSGWTPDLNRQAGDVWFELGDVTRALPYWQLAAASQPDTLLMRHLAEAYVDLQRWTDARDALTQYLQLDPNNLWAHYQLGLILAPIDPLTAQVHLAKVADVPPYDTTVQALSAVLKANPTDPLISMRVGFVLGDHDLWGYAEFAFSQAATIANPFPEALAYVGLSRDKQGKDGSVWVEQAVSLAPQNPRVLYVEGLHYRTQGAYDKSLYILQQAVILDPQNPAYNAELSTAYRLLGDLPQAEAWLKVAVVMSGNDPQFQKLLALFYADEAKNLTSDGIDVLKRAAAEMPNDPDVKASYGWALHQIGQTQDGLAAIDEALKIDPNNPRALFYKARILIDTNQKDQAIPLLQQVVELNGLFAEDARRILSDLGG